MKELIFEQCKALYDEQLPPISNISNILSVLFNEIEHINWAGLYLINENEHLCILGPFLGKPACTVIPFGKGVVGTCAKEKRQIVVENVHLFEGHIACDSDSNSEIVIPLMKDDHLYAILDIDSDIINNFDIETVETIDKISQLLSSLVSRDKIWIF